MNHAIRVLLIVMLASVVGCGGEKKVYAKVKGMVTFNGKPLDKGEITFSVPGKPPTLITISDGKFSGQALVGANTISISAKKKCSATEASTSSYSVPEGLQGEGREPGRRRSQCQFRCID